MNIQDMLFEFLGGLGIFLFGLNFMGDGLQKAAGDNLRSILNSFTSTPLRSIIAGMVVTVLIQSSSATTVLTVGLVSAGFMSLNQAIGVVMGANIGTTITAFIIGINIGAYALPIIAVGSFIIFFSKKSIAQNIGKIILGFGALFIGLELMGSSMAPLENLPQFRELMVKFSVNPLLGVSVGTVLTLVVQSSSALIGILQEMFSHGTMTLDAALPILFGSNIGTTITAVLAALGTSVIAKRTAASHVIFNLVGTIIVVLLLNPFTSLVVMISNYLNLSPAMQIAFAHGLFNIINVLIQMWFISQIADIVTRLIPGEPEIISYDDTRLDQSLIQSAPSMALNQVKLEIEHMSEIVMKEVHTTYKYFKNRDEKDFEKVSKFEEVVNEIDMKLTEYLMLISTTELPLKNSNEHTTLVEVTKYLERIGDHAVHIINNVKEGNQLAKKSSKNGEMKEFLFDEDVLRMYTLIEQNIHEAVESFITNNRELTNNVMRREKEINDLEDQLRDKYIDILNQGIGRPSDSIMFVDIVSSLERMSDHAVRIARHAEGSRYPFQSKKAPTIGVELKEPAN